MSKKHEITAICYDKKGRLLATAKNSYTRSHPVQKHFAKLAGENERIYLHAEIAALLRCGDKKPHSILVRRYKADGSPANAKPCATCALALKAWNVGVIKFTMD